MQKKLNSLEHKVSIIIPTYNRESIIAETIDSILKQTYTNFEIIIIDDGSSDGTSRVMTSYEKNKKISYYQIKHKGYPAPVRNYGIKKAKGEYIAFCDDDDLWFPIKLEKQMKEFKKNPNIGLVCSLGIIFNENGIIGKIGNEKQKVINFEKLLSKNDIVNSSTIVRKTVLEKIGYLNENPDFVAVEDYELWLRIAKKYIIRCIDEPLVKYRIHENALQNVFLTSSKKKQKLKKIYEQFLRKKIIDKELYRKCLNNLEYRVLLSHIIGNVNINIKSIKKLNIKCEKKIFLIFLLILSKMNILPYIRKIKNVLRISGTKIYMDN